MTDERHPAPHDSARPPSDPLSDLVEQKDRLLAQLTERERTLVDVTARLRAAESAAARMQEEHRDLQRRVSLSAAQGSPYGAISGPPAGLAAADGEIEQLRSRAERAEHLRVICAELQRIASHLIAIGTFGLDMGSVGAQAKVCGNLYAERAEHESEAAQRRLAEREEQFARESRQLDQTLQGLTLEIRSHHEAARDMSHQLLAAQTELLTLRAHQPRDPNQPVAEAATSLRAEDLAERVREMREETRELREQVRRFSADAGAAEAMHAMAQDLQQARLQNEVLSRQNDDLSERDQERRDLVRQVEILNAQVQDRQALVEQVEALQSRLYSAPRWMGADDALNDLGPTPTGVGRNIEAELIRLVHAAQSRAAIVADGMGFPVAASGDATVVEGLAALAGIAHRLAEQGQQLLGISEVTQIALGDRNGVSAHVRFFVGSEETMSVATLGPGLPPPASVDRVVEATLRSFSEPRTQSGISTVAGDQDAELARPVYR